MADSASSTVSTLTSVPVFPVFSDATSISRAARRARALAVDHTNHPLYAQPASFWNANLYDGSEVTLGERSKGARTESRYSSFQNYPSPPDSRASSVGAQSDSVCTVSRERSVLFDDWRQRQLPSESGSTMDGFYVNRYGEEVYEPIESCIEVSLP